VGGGRKWKHDSVEDAKNEELALRRVTDGTCRNAIVVTCGSCGYKQKYKGLPPVANNSKGSASKQQVDTPKQKQKDVFGQADVIQLPKSGKSTTLDAGRKTKKQKKASGISQNTKSGKSSGLLDFLSSLND
jgi:hypothetical protein